VSDIRSGSGAGPAPVIGISAYHEQAHWGKWDADAAILPWRYPDRLAGEKIAIGARIIAVCAAFVAMMKKRPFNDAITVTEALAELNRCAGSQFDPQIVEAFCKLVELASS